MSGGAGGARLHGAMVLAGGEVRAEDLARVGGKAAGLAELVRHGFPVPPFAVVTADAFRALLRAAGEGSALADLARRLATPPAADEEAWLAGVAGRLSAAPVPPELAEGLAAASAPLLAGGALLAVRSSGTLEDAPGASFAGLYETVLGVPAGPPLEAAVKRCLASLFAPRVVDYLRRQPSARPAMACVLQRLVPSEVAGVLFTVNPLTGREDETVIEAVRGLGEALVSGSENVQRFVVAPDEAGRLRIAQRTIQRQAAAIRPCEGGGTTRAALPAEEASLPALKDGRLLELADLGGSVQEALGRPVDVEWTFAGGSLQLVQARPVTCLHFAPELGEWTTADFRDGGVSSAVCSPFMWSLYEQAFDASMPAYLGSLGLVDPRDGTKWTRMFFGRPYWNLAAAKGAVGRLPGFVERNFDVDLGIEPQYEGPGRTTPASIWTVLRALPVLVRLLRGYRARLRANARFAAEFRARSAPWDLDAGALAALDRAAFVARFRPLAEELHLHTETSYFTTIYNTSNATLDLKVEFERANRRAGGTLHYPTLVGGLQDLSHLRPMRDLHRLCARLREEGRGATEAELADFAGRWPQRGRKELDPRVPRWPDDLPWVREMVAQALASWRPEDDPDFAASRQHAAYERELARALSALGWLLPARIGLRRKLERLRSFTWWREEMRDYSSRVYAIVRRWALEAGRRLSAEGLLAGVEEVWALRWQEVAAALEGTLAPEEVRRRAAAGARMMRSFRNFEIPNEVGVRHDWAEARGVPTGRTLRGTACSPGRRTGVARVLRDVEEAHRVAQGEILVTPFTDPGWTPLFARLGGVVTETGGLLSHAAVISREYGIPAVLSVAGATRAIRDGDLVTVDGGSGVVELPPA